MKTSHQTRKGFTIVESLVAIAILTAVIIGVTSAVQRGLSSYIFSKDQIVAFYLAQEGFEGLRNVRDENRLNNRDWLTAIAQNSSDPCYYGNACTNSPVESSVLTPCIGIGACPILRQDTSTKFFGYNGSWPETIYVREITLGVVSATEVTVTVKVTWNKGGVTRVFKARENLFNW